MADSSSKAGTDAAAEARAAALMASHGITCVPVDRFHYKSYQYSSLADAVAQAKRDGAQS